MKIFKLMLILSILLTMFGCKENKKNISEQPISKPVENISATPDQIERRKKSEKYCISKNIPIYSNPNSLFVDPEDKVTLRLKDEVVDRALALVYLGLKSEGLEQVHLDKMNKEFNISEKLTKNEKEYALLSNPSEQQNINANWRYESLHVLLWSLSFIDDLEYPNQICSVVDDVKIIYELGEKRFREQAKLRSKKEILDQADLILRFDWACVNARVKNENVPGELNSSIVYERHYSLNWLIKYMKQDWDIVTTNT